MPARAMPAAAAPQVEAAVVAVVAAVAVVAVVEAADADELPGQTPNIDSLIV